MTELSRKKSAFKFLLVASSAIALAPFFRQEWKTLIAELRVIQRQFEQLSDLCDVRPFVVALVLAEDKRFYEHTGVDTIAIMRAIWKTLLMGHRQGASTIEQQLVRVVTHDYRPSISRKIKEIALASRIHNEFDKDWVAAAYLSSAYCGWRMIGIKRAALRLKIDIKAPSDSDVAAIVARIRYPEPRCATSVTGSKIRQRTNFILRQMRERPHLFV